jgi:hypothetical protein
MTFSHSEEIRNATKSLVLKRALDNSLADSELRQSKACPSLAQAAQ